MVKTRPPSFIERDNFLLCMIAYCAATALYTWILWKYIGRSIRSVDGSYQSGKEVFIRINVWSEILSIGKQNTDNDK